MKNTAYYLANYITALESTKVDSKLFADLPTQQAHFRKKCMECIDWDLLNRSELARRAQIAPTKLQDIMRGKTAAQPHDLRAILRVLEESFA